MQAIVCASENWGIGLDNRPLFHISADRKRFRELTLGKTLIIGKRALEGFPEGKPPEGRRCVVLTHSEAPIEGAELAHTAEEAVALAGADAVVAGGSSVYTRLLPSCDRVLVTRVKAAPRADSYFPNLDTHPDWRVFTESGWMEEDGLAFRYVDYVRR